MRPRIAPLLVALVVALLPGLVTLAPAGAAAPRPAPRSSVATPISGETFVLSGSVGRTVRRVVALQYYSRGAWRTKQRRTIAAAGVYRFTVSQGGSVVSWRVRAPKVRKRGHTYATRLTRTTRLTTAAQQAITSVADSTVVGRTVTVSTRFRPVRPGRAVALQHLSGGTWVTVANATQSAAGTATFAYTSSAVGRRSLRAVASEARGAAAYAGPADVLATLPEKPVQVSAHRGDSARYPENTLPAFQAAIREGADWLEMDVRRTTDGVWVLMHDNYLFRTTNVRSVFPDRPYPRVENFTYAQLQQLDAGSWKGSQFVGTPVPTVQQVLDAVEASGTTARLSIEVKMVPDKDDEQNIVDFFDYVRGLHPEWIDAQHDTDKVVITTFSEPAAQHLVDTRGKNAPITLDGDFPYGAEVGLIFDPSSTPTSFSTYTWARQIGISESLITSPARASAVHAAGADLVGWTADSTDDILRLGVSGVDVVTTNDPVKARALLRP